MDPISRENLSALMDGELAAEPTRFLLRRLEHDPELGATWSRWHLIRACLAADAAQTPNAGIDRKFTARVAAAVAAEAVVVPTHRRRWARYVGGGAIAASVAVAALMLNVPRGPMTPGVPVAQTRAAPAAVAAAGQLADVAPVSNRVAPPWLLARQPTVLSAQPASANVAYGTGLMQPDYLRDAAYTRDAALTYAPPFANGQAAGVPFPIMLVPEAPPSSAASGRH
ncbi:MAG: anti-anti-sigma factor [Rhodanobacteraceae bacterium]|nr:MAG: anti-anti-sigma factor [Rhodanobacteraceae bacterium]